MAASGKPNWGIGAVWLGLLSCLILLFHCPKTLAEPSLLLFQNKTQIVLNLLLYYSDCKPEKKSCRSFWKVRMKVGAELFRISDNESLLYCFTWYFQEICHIFLYTISLHPISMVSITLTSYGQVFSLKK